MYARQREIDRQRQDLAKRISAAEERLKQAQSTAGQARWEIVVNVDAIIDVDMELDVSYTVSGASWAPLYDIRLAGEQVSLTYMAQIRQESGEDWPAVTLSLSTARPATSSPSQNFHPGISTATHPPAPRPPQPRSMMAGRRVPAMMKESTTAEAAYGAVPEPAPMGSGGGRNRLRWHCRNVSGDTPSQCLRMVQSTKRPSPPWHWMRNWITWQCRRSHRKCTCGPGSGIAPR